MLEIVFLGTGSGIPSKRRNPASIWFQYEDEVMLFDCGEGTQRQLMSAKLSFMKINHIFITHWHADHWAGIIGLMQTMNMEGRRKTLYIYGPEAERFVSDLLDLDYWGPRFKVIPKNVPWDGKEITKIFSSKGFDIFSTPVKHSVPAVAFMFKENDSWNVDIQKAEKLFGLKEGPLVGKLKNQGKVEIRGKTLHLKDVGVLKKGLKVVYTGDTEQCKTLLDLAKDSDLLIHDATFADEQEGIAHGSAKEAAILAKDANAKRLILTHFSRRYVDVEPIKEDARKTFKNTDVAEDFMRITLKNR